MKKLLLIAIVGTTLMACNNQQKEKKIKTIVQTENSTDNENSKFGRKNFAVIWKWTTTDVEKVEKNTLKFADEMNALWKNGDIENAYYNADSKIDKLEHLPNVSFFLKSKTLDGAKEILNNLTFVKEGIVTPIIYPVGTKWLGRNKKAINKKGIKNSFVAVWSTLRVVDPIKDGDIIMEQSTKLLKLNETGDIENVYWDLEKVNDPTKNKEITDFVFFVNANSEDEARKICDNLPFTKAGIASYSLQSVGVFWLGEYK